MTLKSRLVKLMRWRLSWWPRKEIPEGLVVYEANESELLRNIAHWALMPRKIFWRKKWD